MTSCTIKFVRHSINNSEQIVSMDRKVWMGEKIANQQGGINVRATDQLLWEVAENAKLKGNDCQVVPNGIKDECTLSQFRNYLGSAEILHWAVVAQFRQMHT